MNIQDFAEIYFPRSGQAKGGRIGYAGGGAPVYSESDYPQSLLMSF